MSEIQDQRQYGGEFGMEAANHVDRHSESYCASERQRIETANKPAILSLRARIGQLQIQERDLEGRIYHALPPGTFQARRLRAIFRYAIAALLTVAAFIFSVLAFDPYQLGWKAWLYCLGIAIVTPFLVDRILERWASPRLVTVLATVAGVAAILSLIFLAEIRGDLLAQQVTNTPSAEIDSAQDAPPAAPENNFYDRTLGLLRLVMAFLAFAIEIGAGIALHEAGRLWSVDGEDGARLRRELATVREQMIVHGHEMWILENAGVEFEHRFWREFYRSLLNGVRRGALQKIVIVALSLGIFAHAQARPSPLVDVVVLVDLSRSVAVTGHDSRAEFEKNVQSVDRTIAALPAGAKITVIGITDDSFATPYIILSAKLAGDEGYFKERLANGRAALSRAWRARSAHIAPSYTRTDILGALMVASEVFQESPRGHRKVLIVLSDMKQATRVLNLEGDSPVEANSALRQAANGRLIADLGGVDVYAEGVDGAGESVAHWHDLREFWKAYFVRAGATLAGYSSLREVPNFEQLLTAPVDHQEK